MRFHVQVGSFYSRRARVVLILTAGHIGATTHRARIGQDQNSLDCSRVAAIRIIWPNLIHYSGSRAASSQFMTLIPISSPGELAPSPCGITRTTGH